MAYNALNNLIDAYIYANGVQAITGQILNGVLKQMVSQLGSGYHLMGVAIPETAPEQNDFAMAYFAATAGEYTDFGGITLAAGEVAVLLTSGNGSWSKQTIYTVPTGTADLENTAGFITNAVTDLVNYYTKTEVDDTLAGYPTLEALATALADYYTKTQIDGQKAETDAALADRYTKAETQLELGDFYRKGETYDRDEVDSIVATLNRQEYIVAWDGLSAPDVSAIPAGVTVTYNATPYTGTLAASASTVNKIYMVWNGTAYDMYGTSQDGGYSWVPMGTTTVDLSQYATNAELSQLQQKVTDFEGEVIGFQQEQINLAQYELVNGYIGGTDFYASGNYGVYHRCKFVPISIHHGREISIYKNPNESQPVTFAVVETLPTLDGQNHALDFATGFSEVIAFGDSDSPYQFTIGEDANFIIFYITDTRQTWDRTPQSVILAPKDGNYYNKQETDLLLANKANNSDITDLNGEISGLDERTDNLENECLTGGETPEEFPVTIHTEGGTNGYWGINGAWNSDNTRRSTDKIDVTPGDKFLVTTKISASSLIAFLAQWNGNSFVGVADGFAGGSGDAVDRPYTVPEGVNKIAICSSNSTEPSLKKVVVSLVRNFYNKSETDARFAAKSSEGRYGVKWSITDTDDLGTRCFDAVGKTATIGVGNTDGSSDFDNIYPWSEMKRCNIKVNANGAKIVTFEGETGFSTGGSNGDVFIRIPKFCVEKYKEGGYEYRVVSRNQGFVHPAFIENGEELDEIFVAAFEGTISYNKLRSMANNIPTSNETAQTFLDAATAMGEGFTLYDMRSMDAIWTLYAVEYGSRNTNQYFGYGFADFRQPDKGASGGRFDVKEAATNTNSVKVALLNNDYLYWMPLGSNITVCRNTQTDILTQAKITGITTGEDYTMFTFDGDPIDVDTDCFVGSAGCTTNFCELCGSTKKLNWHTGRAEFVSGSQKQNPMRYRWIENIFGSLWHFTPDITLNGLQLYVCDNIKDYQFGKITAPYRPVGPLMTEQTSNGQKNDNTGVNYWIDSLIDDIFAKGITLGKSFDMSLTSRKAFGAFYYANGSGVRINVNGGGFDHDVRCNMLTNRLWITTSDKWYLYGARLMYKNID